MVDTTLFELVSPERLIMSKDVSMVIIPGTEGLFGVLPRHTSMLSALSPGVVDVYEEDVVTQQFFVINGFAEVTEDRCTVLAEDVILLDKLDPEGLEVKITKMRNDTNADNADRSNKFINQQETILAAMRVAKNSLTNS
jgi:F-type H+-transporting ATPase subunit epsilon